MDCGDRVIRAMVRDDDPDVVAARITGGIITTRRGLVSRFVIGGPVARVWVVRGVGPW